MEILQSCAKPLKWGCVCQKYKELQVINSLLLLAALQYLGHGWLYISRGSPWHGTCCSGSHNWNYFYGALSIKSSLLILKMGTHRFHLLVSYQIFKWAAVTRADSRLASSQWETLQSNAVSHWLGANLESDLVTQQGCPVTGIGVPVTAVRQHVLVQSNTLVCHQLIHALDG